MRAVYQLMPKRHWTPPAVPGSVPRRALAPDSAVGATGPTASDGERDVARSGRSGAYGKRAGRLTWEWKC